MSVWILAIWLKAGVSRPRRVLLFVSALLVLAAVLGLLYLTLEPEPSVITPAPATLPAVALA